MIEPVRLQPHGVMLVLNADLVVVQASTNSALIFGTAPAALLNRAFKDLAGEFVVRQILNTQFQQSRPLYLRPFTVNSGLHNAMLVEAQVLRDGSFFLIDLEGVDATASQQDFSELFLSFRDVLWQMGNNNDLVDYMQAICHQLRILTGFDRIIACRFGTYWDVDVIAESRSDAATSLRDFWFPNSDFPIEERLLCIANPVRVLRDAAAQTVEILASSESNVSFSRCSLLAFPEQRCARLRLIGIGSTMVISLTSQQSLWGMILCHHTKPLTVYAQTREFAEFVGKTTSGRLNRLEQDRIKIKQKYTQKLLDSITLQITDTKDIESTMHCYANDLLSIVDADGVVVCANDWQFSHGATPPQTTLVVLLQWLRSLATSSLCVSDSFPEEFIPARGTGLSGFLLVPLGSNLSGFFLWFRRDALQVLRDGVLDDTNRSKPWSPSDIDAGKLIGTVLETIAANISPDKRRTDDTHINLVQMDETTLPNPDELKQRLDEAIDIGKQRRTKSGIVLIDYAPLQLHQHPAAVGEALVTHLRRMLRSHDMLIQWGDDKFIVVMTEIRGNAQDEVLHQRFTKSAVLPGVEFVRPHIGAAVFPADGLDGTSLIECALNALNASRLS